VPLAGFEIVNPTDRDGDGVTTSTTPSSSAPPTAIALAPASRS
jgi:hypothetical protein